MFSIYYIYYTVECGVLYRQYIWKLVFNFRCVGLCTALHCDCISTVSRYFIGGMLSIIQIHTHTTHYTQPAHYSDIEINKAICCLGAISVHVF